MKAAERVRAWLTGTDPGECVPASAVHELAEQRDELLAACKAVVEADRSWRASLSLDLLGQLDDAIARAES